MTTPADQTEVFPLGRAQFLVASRRGSVTVIRRYSAHGKLIRRFGGRGGLRIAGEVSHAASLGDSGSVVFVGALASRSPELAVVRVDANGVVSGGFRNDGFASVPEFAENRSYIEGIATRRTDSYLLVSTYPAPSDPYSIRNYRIVRLDSRGEFRGASGVVDQLFYPGDSGEPDEFERKIWSTPRGILYARIEQRVSRSTFGRFSLWHADVKRSPILDRTIGSGQGGNASRRYFVGAKLAPTRDGRSLIVCGSTAFYSNASGEHRIRVGLRRLRL